MREYSYKRDQLASILAPVDDPIIQRHTAINNWRLQGHDFFRIMAASGHKTMNVFKRYNTVSKEELRALARLGRKSD